MKPCPSGELIYAPQPLPVAGLSAASWAQVTNVSGGGPPLQAEMIRVVISRVTQRIGKLPTEMLFEMGCS
jgi:hypothetical protein